MRQLLLLLTIIVIASACGASTDTAALEERIAELEGQLNEEQNEPNQLKTPQPTKQPRPTPFPKLPNNATKHKATAKASSKKPPK